MARTIATTVYTFEELSDRAKEQAREWYRSGIDYEADFEFAETAANLLGITFAQYSDGGKMRHTDIRYSGFCSQGDGASFVGSYEFAKGCAKAIRDEYPTDTALHAIADGLMVMQSTVNLLFDSQEPIRASITQSGRDYHKYTMDVEIEACEADADVLSEEDVHDSDVYKTLLELMRDFAQWIYDGLEAEYEYQHSDEAVDESIIANEYEFTEDGARA